MEGLNQNSAPSLILVKTALDKIVDQSMLEDANVGRAEATDPVVFTQDTAQNAAVVSTVIGGGAYFEKTLDDIAPNKGAAVSAPAAKTTLIAQFRKDLDVSRTFMEDQQHSAVSRAVKQQSKTWIASRDRNAFSVYGNGFGTTQNTTIDGQAPFSNTHTSQNGDTVDNYETGALNDDNLNITVNSLRRQIAQTGVRLGYEPKGLLLPTALHSLGMRVAKSVLRAGTGNNDLNYWSEMYPGMKVVYSQFLDDFSTTAYYVMASGHGIYRFEREAFFTRLIPWETQRNDAYIYKMRAREEVDSIEYSGLVGNDGTTS